ncbi:TPA: GTP pyrophosphokinase family protein [Clostridioides difficile]
MILNGEIQKSTGLLSREDFLKFIFEYQQAIMLYESAIKNVTTQLEILEQEYHAKGWRTPFHSFTSRIKEPLSIYKKMQKLNVPLDIESIHLNLNDVAGVRIICNYIHDIYSVKELLIKKTGWELLIEKDYIMSPKKNGYRSLHLIINVPVVLRNNVQIVRCEIQLRTCAMDSWASLEHTLRYKKELDYDETINAELRNCADMLYQSDLKMQSIANKTQLFDCDI